MRRRRTGRPAPPPLSGDSRCTIPPAHARSRRHPLGVVGEPAAGRIPSVPSVGGWSRLGASSRPQIGRWDRRQCHMPDFWVTGRPRNPLNASVATFCAAGVISMHQTPPGMVRGVSGVSRGRFVAISTGSHSERLPYYRNTSCSLPLAMATTPRPRPRLHDSRGPRRGRGRPGSRARPSGALAASMQREGAVPDSFVQNKMTRASHLQTK